MLVPGVQEYLDKEKAFQDTLKLKKDDVWGRFNRETHKMESDGLVVARQGEKCPVFGDVVPYKSVTVVCLPNQEVEVNYWLTYVQGGNNVSRRKVLKGGEVALRSDYQCW